ncbi:MAG TPA: tRNA pseudouridine(13) synthase TruD, partial [Chloroflexi bacterium]|nr:tRNA pseudouridine(13) synthase TruD [Chloroflexota bacterium]
MRLKQIPEDFQVEELIELPLSEEGAYTYYRIKKAGIATLDVQNDLAERLKVTPSGLVFPA